MTDSLAQTGASLAEQLRSLAGREHVRPAEREDAADGTAAGWVVEPGSEEEVAAVLRFANQEGLAVIPRGGGTKLEWGNPPRRADVILSLLRLNQVLEHAWADLTVTVQAGCTFAQLQSTLAKHGQRLALDPLWPERATIGGILSTNDTGALRLRYGGLRDLIIGATLALADGTLAKSGGKVVKNVAGYDLCKLATGAMGTLGVITRAVFRVHPLAAGARTLSIPAGGLKEMQRLILGLLNSNLTPACIQIRMSSGSEPIVHIGLEGNDAGLGAQESRIQSLAHPLPVSPASAMVWAEREELCAASGTATAAKISVVPTAIAAALNAVAALAARGNANWRAAIQATGIGWLRIEAEADAVPAMLQKLRAEIEANSGALVVLRIPAAVRGIDMWGGVGDALPVMLAVKRQFDPRGTLNPGRFVGGI